MEQEAIVKQMKVLKNKAKAARVEGHRAVAKAFKHGAKRLFRKLRAARAVAMKVAAKATKAT